MSLLTIILALLLLPRIASLLAFIPEMIEDLEIFRNVLLHEIFSILLIPIYLASITVLLKRNIETSNGLVILFIIAIFSILIAIGIRGRGPSLWQAFTGRDFITLTIVIIFVLLATIVYFGSYFVIARIVR